jgi:hypothetical protein
MGNLVATRTVMDLVAAYADSSVTFSREAEEGEDRFSRREIKFSYEDWVELGGPTKITVTIEPGDLLND